MIWLLLGVALAEPAAEEPASDAPVVDHSLWVDLGSGARLNWTAHRLEVTAEARPQGSATRKAVEQGARRKVDERLLTLAVDVRVSPETTLQAVLEDEALADPTGARLARWEVVETRYHTSGRVVLVAQSDLRSVLRPWALGRIVTGEQAGPEVLVDARSVTLSPCFAPTLLGPEGEALFEGKLTESAAVSAVPAHWLRVAPAEMPPVLLHATEGAGCTLTVDAGSAERLREPAVQASLRGGGLQILVQ